MTVSNDGYPWQKVYSRAEESGNYSHRQLMSAFHPLRSARLSRSSSRAKVADAARGKREPRDKVCEMADAPVSFKFDMRKHFSFQL